jgi:hypothetical protein
MGDGGSIPPMDANLIKINIMKILIGLIAIVSFIAIIRFIGHVMDSESDNKFEQGFMVVVMLAMFIAVCWVVGEILMRIINY